MIRKRGDVWYSDFAVGTKRIRRSLETTNRNEALARAWSLKGKYEEHIGRKSPTFSAFGEQYIEWAWSEKPASTLGEKQRLAKMEIYFSSLGVKYLADITPYHIEQLKAHLNSLTVGINKKRPYTKTTVNHYLQILRCMFNRAIDWEQLDKSPMKKVKFYKIKSPVKALTDEQVDKVMAIAKAISLDPHPKSQLQTHFYYLCRLALHTGMRKSEVLNLQWKDVRDGIALVKGKGGKVRKVPLNTVAEEIIGGRPQRSKYVFDIDNRNQHDLMRRTTYQIKKRTGIDFHFHLLRHTFATKLIERGVDLVTLAAILGHSKMTISLIYSHTNGEKMASAVKKLE